MRDKMRRRQREPSIPIFGYYLTFIHYFGFSINQNVGSIKSLHNLPITKRQTKSNSLTTPKQAKVLNHSTTTLPKSTITINNSRKRRSRSSGKVDNNLRWFTRHKSHESKQPVKDSLKGFIGLALKGGVKFIAISFTTFLALNHCIVLVDYIYHGTMRFEELMFDFRLVITKISALIFVLSWHFNQLKVDKLIKLVESTSIYILSTQSGCERTSVGDGKLFGRTLSGSNLTSAQLSSNKQQHHQNLLNSSSSWARSPNGEKSFNEAFRGLTRAEFEAIIKFNASDRKENKREKLGEGDKELCLFTAKVSKRILRWWLMCICVTVVHFSLSEAEIFKSHHLWTWLDDYSMHQLSNKTTSLTTLMFLASFDNYIYTVHVYGARLVGASIICIVCSLQRDNIDFLRFQVLQMLQVSSLYKVRNGFYENNNNTKILDKSITSKKAVDESNLVSRQTLSSSNGDQKRENIVITSERIKLAELSCSGEGANVGPSKGGASYIPSSNRNNNHNNNFSGKENKNIDASFAEQALKLQIDSNAIQKSNDINNINNEVCETSFYEFDGNKNDYENERNGNSSLSGHDYDHDDEVSYPTNRDLFFVLGESDWLELEDNLNRLKPCGYLSSPICDAREYFCSNLRQLILGLVNVKRLKLFEKLSKNRISCSRNNLIEALDSSMKEQVSFTFTSNLHRQQQQQRRQPQPQPQGQKQKQRACRKVTPTPTCSHNNVVNSKTEQAKLSNQINASCQLEGSLMSICSSVSDELAGVETTPKDAKIIGEHGQLRHFHANNDLFQQVAGNIKTKAATTETQTTTTPVINHYPLSEKDSSFVEKAVDKREAENLLFKQNGQHKNNQQALKDDNRTIKTTTRNYKIADKANSQEQQTTLEAPANASEMIEWQLERLASKYELVRTVNSRIDSCFGPMLLIQYSFLFLMSCIDVVYFSICFNPNTKTKYIIISGMILLWWPYLLLYKFASDIGSSSKELLISVRRLARLSLVEHHQSSILLLSQQQHLKQPLQFVQNRKCQINADSRSGVTCSPLATITTRYHPSHSTSPSYINMNPKSANNFHLTTLNSLLDYNLERRKLRFQSAGGKENRNNNYNETTCRLSNLNDNNTHCRLRNRSKLSNLNNLTRDRETNDCFDRHSSPSLPLPLSLPSSSTSTLISKTRARIINKLDHVFKPTNLSIIGIMTIDKFFLLNFAKIVITASVMVIQFISY